VIIEIHPDHDSKEPGYFGHATMVNRPWWAVGTDQPIVVHDRAARS
jgi:hypothetical protein